MGFSGRLQTIESPIITVEDRLLIGKKAKRHKNAGDAVSVAEWQELPILIANVKTVLYDVKNDSVLYILKSLDEKVNTDKIINTEY